jgi:hypothetical protein
MTSPLINLHTILFMICDASHLGLRLCVEVTSVSLVKGLPRILSDLLSNSGLVTIIVRRFLTIKTNNYIAHHIDTIIDVSNTFTITVNRLSLCMLISVVSIDKNVPCMLNNNTYATDRFMYRIPIVYSMLA